MRVSSLYLRTRSRFVQSRLWAATTSTLDLLSCGATLQLFFTRKIVVFEQCPLATQFGLISLDFGQNLVSVRIKLTTAGTVATHYVAMSAAVYSFLKI